MYWLLHIMFLHIENQQIIWQTLQKSPYLVEFTQKFPGHRETWFRGVSEQFYMYMIKNNRHIPSNAIELLETNKQAIMFMVADLKKLLGYSQESSREVALSYAPYPSQTRRQIGEMNEQLFNKYQTEYNQLLEGPKVAIKELPSESTDSKITNMEELVKEHVKRREMDLSVYSPKTAQPEKNVNRVRILNELDTIEMSIEEYVEEGKKKSVHWSNDVGIENNNTFASGSVM